MAASIASSLLQFKEQLSLAETDSYFRGALGRFSPILQKRDASELTRGTPSTQIGEPSWSRSEAYTERAQISPNNNVSVNIFDLWPLTFDLQGDRGAGGAKGAQGRQGSGGVPGQPGNPGEPGKPVGFLLAPSGVHVQPHGRAYTIRSLSTNDEQFCFISLMVGFVPSHN